MIFVSLVLLVVAAVAIGIGIASSSVPPLVLAIICTIAAVIVLWWSFIHYRRQAAERGEQVTGLGGNRPRNPGYPESYAGPESYPGAAPTETTPPGSSVVPADWSSMHETRAAATVSVFNLDELHEVRRYEIEHAARRAVLDAIDERITAIVDLQRPRTDA